MGTSIGALGEVVGGCRPAPWGPADEAALLARGQRVRRQASPHRPRVDWRDGDGGGEDAPLTGDLLVVEGNGSQDQIGRVAVWDGSVDPCLHQNHIIRVRFRASAISRYVLIWLLSRPGREAIVRVASSTSGLYTLSLSKVVNLPVCLPPVDEQAAIVQEVGARVSLAERLDESVLSELGRAARLRQSVLRAAFAGRLVAQDPADEPADRLLERIKAKQVRGESQASTRGRLSDLAVRGARRFAERQPSIVEPR